MPEAHSAARVLGGQSGHAAASAAAPLFATPDSVSEYEVDDLADRVTASSLDTQESTSHFHQDLYRNFRHSGWHRQRLAVLKQIDRFCGGFDQPPSRTAYTYVSRDRFCRCGSYAWVQRTVDDPPSYRVVSQHCRHRFCLPCQQDRGRLIAANLREKLPQAQLRFVTLTVRALDMSLAEALDHLYDSFSRLRRTNLWRDHVRGGLAVLQISWRPEHGRWHPHFHVLCEGNYLPHEALRLAWHKITSDSYVVDVRAVKSSDNVADYLAKDLTKSMAKGVWQDPGRLREAMFATHGRKLLFAFGTWHRLKLLEPPDDDRSWETLCSAGDLLYDALRGSTEALSIATRLWHRPFVDWHSGVSECSRSPPI